ncbi:MAG TPA: hypothetical protein VNY29_00335 [Terriglobales bacterium]|nr:hypothetical protein [Terriglobales bacterium]
MFRIVLAIVVLVMMVGIGSNLVMRIRLAKTDPSIDKHAWWKRGSDEVGDTYRARFSSTSLPLINQLSFWAVVTIAAVALVFAFLGK